MAATYCFYETKTKLSFHSLSPYVNDNGYLSIDIHWSDSHGSRHFMLVRSFNQPSVIDGHSTFRLCRDCDSLIIRQRVRLNNRIPETLLASCTNNTTITKTV